jgi:hypothetical protein
MGVGTLATKNQSKKAKYILGMTSGQRTKVLAALSRYGAQIINTGETYMEVQIGTCAFGVYDIDKGATVSYCMPHHPCMPNTAREEAQRVMMLCDLMDEIEAAFKEE